MSGVSIPIRQRAALRTNQYARNGTYPAAYMQAYMQEEANHLLWVRSKQVGRWTCPIQSIPATNTAGTSATRWRFVTHSGTHASRYYARMIAARSYTDGTDAEPFVRLLIELSDGTDVGTIDFHMSNVQKSSDTPNEWHETVLPLRDSNGDIVELTPDTDYYGTFIDFDGGRLISATVYETSLAADTDNGYLPDGPVAGSPVFDEDRGDLTTVLRTAWKRNAANLWHWASNTDSAAPTNATATDTNVIDGSTSVSGASAGATLDLRNRSTVRRTTVPCKFFVYGKNTVGVGSNGQVQFKDSGGTNLLTVNLPSTTAAWFSGTVNLPATQAKYDVTFDSGAGTTTVYAFSLIQYET